MGSAAEQPEATRGSQILSSRRDESAVWTEGFRDRFHGIVSPLLFNGLVLLASALHATILQASAFDKQMWHKPTPVPTVVVTITTDSSSNFAFSPQTLSIASGTIVIWRNSTSAPHTVTGNAFGAEQFLQDGRLVSSLLRLAPLLISVCSIRIWWRQLS